MSLQRFWFEVTVLTLLVGWQEGHAACKKFEWWGTGTVICLERDADLHMAQLMPLPLTVSCFSKIQTGVTFLVPAYPGSPGNRAVKWVCVCVTVKIVVGSGEYRLTVGHPSSSPPLNALSHGLKTSHVQTDNLLQTTDDLHSEKGQSSLQIYQNLIMEIKHRKLFATSSQKDANWCLKCT